jgi:cell division protein FtsN
MSIEKLIKLLLLENKSVIIPEIGELATIYQPATKNNANQTISPPSQSIEFRNNITKDFNEELAHAIAQYKKINMDKASYLLKEYVSNIKKRLEKNEQVKINDLGHFFVNKNNQIEFKDKGHDNLFFETFGMEPVKYTAKSKSGQTTQHNKNINKMTTKKTPEGTNNTTNYKIWIPIVISVIIIVLVIVFYSQHEVKKMEDVSFYPTEEPDKKIRKSDSKKSRTSKKMNESKAEKKKANDNDKIKSEEYIEQQLKEKAKKENALKLQAQMAKKDSLDKQSHRKFYLVAGSFNEYQNAREYKEKLEDKGYQPKILDDVKDNNNYYRVYIGAFSKKKNAMDKLNQLRQKENDDFVWLLTK